ncbi:MAG: pilus assembly PilX N-terminal domain-containing protein [bacterium]
MYNLNPSFGQDSKGIALVLVLLIMAVLFLMGSAALTNMSTDFKTCYNYKQSLQALNSCEAGIAEAIARIKTNQIEELDQWQPAININLLNYQYMISYDSGRRIYRIGSKGMDSSGFACTHITAEYLSSFSADDIRAPVHCATGDFDSTNPSIIGDETCPGWADSTTDTNLPCVVTPSDPNSALDFEDYPGNLITDNPTKILYNSPLPDLAALAEYYGENPNYREFPIGSGPYEDFGAKDGFKVVHINHNLAITGHNPYTGYGVLVVNGNLIVTGHLIWHGIVIVMGNIDIKPIGEVQLTGTIMTPNDCQIRGNSSIQWCSGMIKSALELGVPSPGIISWKEE